MFNAIESERAHGCARIDPEQCRFPVNEGADEQMILLGTFERKRFELESLRNRL